MRAFKTKKTRILLLISRVGVEPNIELFPAPSECDYTMDDFCNVYTRIFLLMAIVSYVSADQELATRWFKQAA